jgi:hypothetical protein
MGRRDFKQREPKKAKKDTRKIPITNILAPPPPLVEVIKIKGKKEAREDED